VLLLLGISSACGATAPMPDTSAWPFGDAASIVATRIDGAEAEYLVPLPDSIAVTRESEVAVLSWPSGSDGLSEYRARVAFHRLNDGRGEVRWVAVLEDLNSNAGARGFVGLVERDNGDGALYRVQVVGCSPADPEAENGCALKSIQRALAIAARPPENPETPTATYRVQDGAP
jgi:hypothetical protein